MYERIIYLVKIQTFTHYILLRCGRPSASRPVMAGSCASPSVSTAVGRRRLVDRRRPSTTARRGRASSSSRILRSHRPRSHRPRSRRPKTVLRSARTCRRSSGPGWQPAPGEPPGLRRRVTASSSLASTANSRRQDVFSTAAAPTAARRHSQTSGPSSSPIETCRWAIKARAGKFCMRRQRWAEGTWIGRERGQGAHARLRKQE